MVRRSIRCSALAVLCAVAVLSSGCGDAEAAPEASGEQREETKVTVAGDSIALGLGVAMRGIADGEVTRGGAPLDVTAIGVDATGLARPDVFDWPARLEDLAAEFPPEVLVFSVGSNDSQDLTDANGDVVATMADAAAWEAEYSRRLAAVFDAFRDTSTTVVWLGQARPADERVADGNRRIHELATEVASDRDWVVVADLAELTGSGADATSDCLAADGLHLTRDCYERAAEGLLARRGIT